MSRPLVRDGQSSFSGGINTVSDAIALQPNQFRRGINARLTEYGAVSKRNGSFILTDGAVPAEVLAGFTWFKSDGTAEMLTHADDGELYSADPLIAIGSGAWVAVTASLSVTQPSSFEEFIDTSGDEVVYIADGGKLSSYDGTTWTRLSTLPIDAKVIKVHNQRLWSCGDADHPASIFYSPLNNGDYLGDGGNGGGEIIVRTFGDEKVVALASVGSSLLIFHRRGLSRLTGFGQDDISVDPEGISSQTGTIAPWSVVEGDGVAFFISDRGAYVATEGSVQPLSSPTAPDPILPLIRQLTVTQFEDVRAVLSRRTQEVWFYIPSFGVYVYNIILRSWTGPWTGEHLTTNAMWASPVASLSDIFVLRTGTDGYVTVADYSTARRDKGDFNVDSSGDLFTMIVQLRRLYFGDDSVAKAFRFGYLTADLGAIDEIEVSWQSDFSTYPQQLIIAPTGNTWNEVGLTWDDSLTWNDDPGSQSYRVQMGGSGYYVDVTFTHDTEGVPVLSRWQMDASILGRR